ERCRGLAGRLGWRRGPLGRKALAPWELEDEGGAAAGRLRNPDLAVVALHQPLADGQPEPGPFDLAARLQPVELVEDGGPPIGWDAGAVVGDADPDAVVHAGHAHVDGAAGRGVLDGVL